MGDRRLVILTILFIGVALLTAVAVAVVVRDDDGGDAAVISPVRSTEPATERATAAEGPRTGNPAPSAQPGGVPTAHRSEAPGVTSSRPPTASPSAEPAPAPTDEPTEARDFTVLMSGDVLLHENMWAQAKRDGDGRDPDFRPMLADVRPAITAADIAICHMETPVGPSDGPFSGYPIFSVPPQVVPALAWAGYDACTTASNHTIDKGEDGVTRTLDAMDDAGLAHAGSARTAREAAHVTILEVGDATDAPRLALLSYTYGLNGLQPPDGKEWIVDLIDEQTILADAALARMRGADVVLVALHWGNEYQHDPTPEQRELAQALLTSPDVDLVYGHHAHVVQPFEVINDKWVAYGLGNHLAEQSSRRPRTHEGVMARFTFAEDGTGEWAVTAAEYLPTRMPMQPPYHLVDLSAERDDRADEDAYERISELVESLGAADEGLRPAG